MYCPSCKDEFRPGFEHCASCDVPLVESLDDLPPEPADEPEALFGGGPVKMADYCGFLALDDARQSRDTLAEHGIKSEIVIRAAPDSSPQGPVQEEYWLRVELAAAKQVAALLEGDD